MDISLKNLNHAIPDLFFQVAAGNVNNASSGQIFARNSAAAVTTESDLWDQNLVATMPAAAVAVGVSSADANDTSAGTGARTVQVSGLDTNYIEVSETVTLTGQTKVVTTQTFLRVNKIEVLTAGSGGKNAGAVYAYDTADTVTAGVPQTQAKIMGKILIGNNVSQSGFFTVPAGKQMIITDMVAMQSITSSLRVKIRTFGGLFKVLKNIECTLGGIAQIQLKTPIVLDEKTDLKLSCLCLGVAITSDISALLSYILVKKG